MPQILEWLGRDRAWQGGGRENEMPSASLCRLGLSVAIAAV